MEKVVIEIGGQKFGLLFNFFTFLKISKIWGIEGMGGVGQKIASFILPSGDFSFDAYEPLSDICYAAAMIENPEAENTFDRTACQQYLFENGEKLAEIMVAFSEAMPKPKDGQQGKRKAAKK